MHFPKFWAKAQHEDFTSWGWSDHSEADARSRAAERASAMAKRLKGKAMEPSGIYPYGNRPLREPELEEHKDARGKIIAAISRNAMGCDVLNTETMMFVDIDKAGTIDAAGGQLFAWLKKVIFGVTQKNDGHSSLEKVRSWCEQNHSRGVRVYQTFNGYRLLVTGETFDPSGGEARAIFELFGADPAYANLCSRQKSFRARLSPKPWRCGMPSAPVSWPFEDRAKEMEFREWRVRYEEAAHSFATCRFLEAIGSKSIPRELEPLVKLHDERTRATSGLPLA